MIQWVALKTIPVHRAEFDVLHRITQQEHPALLPFETVKVVRHKKRAVEKKYALFPRYVFVGLGGDVAEDYYRLRDAIPNIQGIVSRERDDWSPLIMPTSDVAFISDLVAREAGATEIDLHKALKVGKRVEVRVGDVWQETKIDEITRKKIKVILNMLGSMHVVEVPFDKVRAA